jgi:nucleoid DNA-binding protein
MKNLTEISSALAKIHPELTNKKALDITRSVIGLFTQGLCEIAPDSRERVAIAGFGNFGVKTTKERTVKNIKTKESVTVPAGVRIIFKPADELRKAVQSGDFKVAVPAADAVAEEVEESAPAETPAPKKAKKAKKVADKVDVSAIPDLNDI